MNKILTFLSISLLLISACSGNQGSNQSVSSIQEASSVEPMSSNQIEIEATTKYEKEDKTIYRDNLKIVGELYIPNNSYDVFPLVILSHGFGGNMDDLRNLGIKFVKEGVAAFIYDFIGGGNSIKSDGKLTDMSVLTEASDLNTVLDYLKEDERINTDNVFLLGQSQGGFVSTYVASTRDDIKGLIDYYPAFVIRDDALAQYKSADEVPDPYRMTKMGATLGKIYYVDAVSFDIFEVMENCQCNTLIMHGSSDNIVPVSYSERALAIIPHCELKIYQGAGHGFSGSTATDADNRAVQFLKDNLN